jgi:hypothetical protein
VRQLGAGSKRLDEECLQYFLRSIADPPPQEPQDITMALGEDRLYRGVNRSQATPASGPFRHPPTSGFRRLARDAVAIAAVLQVFVHCPNSGLFAGQAD